MSKKKKRIFLVTCVAFFLLIALFLLFFFLGFLEDKEKTKEQMQIIQEAYVSFKTSIESYNDVYDKVYTTLFEGVYYETMEEEDFKRKAVLKEEEKIVQDVFTTSKMLKKVCDGIIYPDASINTKCSSFALAYEQVVNHFVSHVDAYNQQIKDYNMWASSHQKTSLMSYETTFNYIDFDHDKVYSGKESNDGKS